MRLLKRNKVQESEKAKDCETIRERERLKFHTHTQTGLAYTL